MAAASLLALLVEGWTASAGGALGGLVEMLGNAGFGIVAGAIVLVAVTLGTRMFAKREAAAA